MTYTCNGLSYEANSLREAWLMALNQQGVEAIGSCVIGTDGAKYFSVCLKAYREAFPQFTDEDYLIFEIVETRAWLEFPTEIYMGYDDDYDEVEITKLCDEGMKFIHDNSKLARYMDEVDFCW